MESPVRRTAEAAAVAALRPLLGLALAAERVLFDLGLVFDFGMMENIQCVLIQYGCVYNVYISLAEIR